MAAHPSKDGPECLIDPLPSTHSQRASEDTVGISNMVALKPLLSSGLESTRNPLCLQRHISGLESLRKSG